MVYMWSKYNKDPAIISTKAMNNSGYMIFKLISTKHNRGVSLQESHSVEEDAW